MPYVTEDNLTDVALERWKDIPDPRLRQIMQSLIKHHCCCCCLSPITSGHDRRGGQSLQGGKCPAVRVFAQPDITGPGCGDAPGTVSHLVFPTDYFAFS